uniref:Uncharacterized protein n=1 Tax=Cyanistes caeruleus TaxID=156563 RepID=A0A8C0VJQ1_CYACU
SLISPSASCHPPEATSNPVLLATPCPSVLSCFFSTSWKMVGTAVGFSNRCLSSSRLEKLSLVKCSLQRKEYLVGVQLSL